MIKTVLQILLISSFSFSAKALCTPIATDIYSFYYGGHKYEIIKKNLNWQDAAACALYRGGKLAEINSKAEQDSIFYNIGLATLSPALTVAPDGGGASYLWIGANDIKVEGNWEWDGDYTGATMPFWTGVYPTGTSIGGLYSNWGKEPDDFGGQDALGLAITNWPLGVAGQWNDLATSNLLYFIIEYPNCNISKSINKTGSILTPVETGESYQWYDCLTKTIIPGATLKSYSPTKNGKYAVIISIKGCFDTTDCIDVIGSSILENEQNFNQFNILPNPSHGFYRINLEPKIQAQSNVSVYNLLGSLVYQKTTKQNEFDIDLGNSADGIYLLRIEQEGNLIGTAKLIKQ